MRATARPTKLFPDSPRVIYANNPLEEVICQLRFPPILRVEQNISTFQDAIRKQYPFFKERSSEQVKIPDQLSNLVRVGTPEYEFTSEDQQWTLAVTREFIALVARKYNRWEEFREHFDLPLQAFIQQFSPSFYTRIGLRYRDVIKRSILGLTDSTWATLLKPHITAELSLPEIAGSVRHVAHEVLFELESEDSQVQIRHGLAREKEDNEQVYVIDSDFFTTKKTEINDGPQRLGYFNRQAGCLFRWCITDRLHQAMEPQPVG